MFSFTELERVQVEITNRCQAGCPMCLRNVHGGIDNPLLKLTDWSLQDFKEIFNLEVLAQLKTINFCGDFGDPILNNDLIGMCQYIKDNSNLNIIINTNGSARNTAWWEALANAMPTNHRIEFAIDGLSDTHSIYRIGTNFETIIRNAQAFMSSGGIAHWIFIKFKHNEHQVETARNLSSSLGFKSFDFKISKRFGKKFPVLDSAGNVTHYIEQPTNSDIKSVEFIDLKDYKKWNTNITCFTFDEKELYIDAHGHLMPCCLIASFLYANYDVNLYKKYGLLDTTSITGLAREVQLEVHELIKEFGGFDSLDAKKHGIKQIMDKPIWKELIHKKWKDNSSSTCKILCSNISPYIKVDEQLNRAS